MAPQAGRCRDAARNAKCPRRQRDCPRAGTRLDEHINDAAPARGVDPFHRTNSVAVGVHDGHAPGEATEIAANHRRAFEHTTAARMSYSSCRGVKGSLAL